MVCLVLTTLPAALGALSESLADVSEENTMVTDEWIINDTIPVDSAEQKIKADNATVVNIQINPEASFLNDSAVARAVPEEKFDKENSAGLIMDNRLREASPNTVYKEKSYLDIGGRPGIGKYREMLLFDLSEYGDAEGISSATLYLLVLSGWEGKTRRFGREIYRPVAAWNPENVTCNSRDNNVLWIQPWGDWFDRNAASQGDAPYATITLKANSLPDNRYYELDVTDFVKEHLSGKYENTGFLIKTHTESADYVAFYSCDTENEEQHPKLNIEKPEDLNFKRTVPD